MTKRENKSPSRSTKRALTSSVLALVLCFVMLLGTTFAWFTDTASTKVNQIQAGKLDVALLMKASNGTWVSAEGQTLNFVKSSSAKEGEALLWEPGCTYELPAIKVVNNGNLALKYKVVVSGVVGDSNLAEVLDVIYSGPEGNDEQTIGTLSEYLGSVDPDGAAYGSLAAGADSGEISLKLRMQASAGNQYQGQSIEGIVVTVLATQDAVEFDSNNNTYDANATFDASAGTEQELKTAIESGGFVVLTSDIKLTGAIEVSGTAVLDLNGHSITADSSYPAANDYLLAVKRSGDLTINDSVGTGCVDVGNNSDIYTAIKLTVSGEDENGEKAKLTINGGTFVGTYYAICGNGGRHNTELVINGGTFKATYVGDNGPIYHPQNGTVVINGGIFTGYSSAIEMRGGDLTINGGEFTATAGSYSYSDNSSGSTTIGAALVVAPYGDKTVSVSITGGSFTGAKAIAVNNTATVSISGGTFTSTSSDGFDPSSYLVTDYSASKVNNTHYVGKSVVTEKTAVTSGTTTLSSDVSAVVDATNGIDAGSSTYALYAVSSEATLDGKGHTLNVVNGGATAGVTVGSGSVKNLTITGAWRGVMVHNIAGNVTIDNVVIDGCGYALNTGSKANGDSGSYTLTVNNSTLNGWSSWANLGSASFTNCSFGSSTYYSNEAYQHLVRPYVTTTFTNCDFEKGFYIQLDNLAENGTITLSNCTCDGVKLTSENFADYVKIVTDFNNHVAILATNNSVPDNVTIS